MQLVWFVLLAVVLPRQTHGQNVFIVCAFSMCTASSNTRVQKVWKFDLQHFKVTPPHTPEIGGTCTSVCRTSDRNLTQLAPLLRRDALRHFISFQTTAGFEITSHEQLSGGDFCRTDVKRRRSRRCYCFPEPQAAWRCNVLSSSG